MKISYEMGKSLYLNITNRCTNECVFCVRNRNVGEYLLGNDLWLEREPTVDEIINDLEKRDLTNYESVVFCGFGEPLVRADAVLEVAKWLNNNGARKIRINTNGHANLIHGRDVAADFTEILDTMSISLNAKNAEEYDKICVSEFGETAFEGVLEFARCCVNHGIQTILSVVEVLSTEDIEECRKISENCGAEFRIRELI